MTSVFIDGSAGTTGLRIADRLAARSDVCLIHLSEDKRKDEAARREALNDCDVAFLCLPDVAAREAVAMIENPHVRVLDTSTAHRVAPGWAYGFPELSKAHREEILSARRIAVPGCHASGFIVLVRPLIEAGLMATDVLLSCHSLTGYSGGGRKMIEQYEAEPRAHALDAPRTYALTQAHKHLPEMQAQTGLMQAPVFCPIVADFYSGMSVTVPVFAAQLKGGTDAEAIRALYRVRYTGPVVTQADVAEGGFLSANALSGSDRMSVTAQGNAERIILNATYDNLGKGASGAAVQLFNLITGAAETAGLEGLI